MTFFERFFEEKEIKEQLFEVEHNGEIHMISSDTIIEMMDVAPESEQEAIEQQLRTLDFNNRPIEPFLEHLAECYVKTQRGV